MSTEREMPKYQSIKKVCGLKIKEIGLYDEDGGAQINPEEEGYDSFDVSQAYVDKHNPKKGGYYVVYEDGYKSFSPAEAFEKGNIPYSDKKDWYFNFGKALIELKSGRKVARKGWNGKGMWLILINGEDNDICSSALNDMKGKTFDLLPWIGMKTADDKFVPWLASQTDVLAEDWEVL